MKHKWKHSGGSTRRGRKGREEYKPEKLKALQVVDTVFTGKYRSIAGGEPMNHGDEIKVFVCQ